jgi:hypothetical protein
MTLQAQHTEETAGGEAGTSTMTQGQPAANSTTIAKLRAVDLETIVEHITTKIKADIDSARAANEAEIERIRSELNEAQAEAERARAANEEMARRVAGLEAEAERARAEGGTLTQGMERLTRNFNKHREENELRAKYRQDDIDNLFIRMDRADNGLKDEIEVTRTEFKGIVQASETRLKEGHKILDERTCLMQDQIALLGENVVGGGVSRLGRIVLDNIDGHFSTEPMPLPDKLEMAGLKTTGKFYLRQCESMLVDLQPMIKNSEARSCEVFRYLTHGRYLLPGGAHFNGEYVNVYVAENLVAFKSFRDSRVVLWERNSVGRWKPVAWE